MIAMRAQLAPALLLLLLLLILLPSAAPLAPALTPQEIRDRKINGANKLYFMSAGGPAAAYAGEKKPAPESKEEAPKVGAGAELQPESKGDEKVLKAKINDEVKQMRKEAAAYDDAVAEKKAALESNKEEAAVPESKSDEKVPEAKIKAEVKQMRKEAAQDDGIAEEKAKEYKSKPKNTTDDAEDHAKEKKSKSKLDYSEDDDGKKKEKKSKNKDDDEEEKKSKSKSKDDDDDDDDDKKKKRKSKSKDKDDDDDDEKKEKKSKSKDKDDDDDDDDKKKEKKSKKKDKDDDDDDDDKKKEKKSKKKDKDDEKKKKKEKKEKKSKEKSESSEEDAGEKKESKSKDEGDDFDAVPVETNADESMPAVDTPDGYATPTKKTPPYQAPVTTMSATDSPDGYAAPTTMSATDSPDGEEVTSNPVMSASDSPDGYVPATDSPDGEVSASDSPDGYDEPSTKPKLNVQSFESMVPRPLLDILSPEVKSLCAKTRFPYTCETSIAKLPETTIVPARQKDGLGILTLAVDAVRAKIAEARNAAKELAADPHLNKVAKTAIDDCMAMYDDISTSYDTGMAALKRGDKATAATSFDAASTFVDTCDQGFLDRKGLKPGPAVAGDEKVLAELSSNVLALNKYT